MYFGNGCLCVCLSVPSRIPTLLHAPGSNLGNGSECRLIVDYWVDLQSVRVFCCCDNILLNSKCQRVLVLALAGSYSDSAADKISTDTARRALTLRLVCQLRYRN